MAQRLALFDFDGTLVSGDSLPCFIAACVGWPKTCWTALWSAVTTLGAVDRRTAFKASWLQLCLGTLTETQVATACQQLATRLHWKTSIVDRLRWHQARGDMIVVASGGLDLYLPCILHKYAVTHILCTHMTVTDHIVTGTMQSANCVRTEKARRVQEFIAATGPFEEIWAYGNLPHDLPMLALATHRVIV